MAKDGEKILKKSAGVSGLSITKDVLKPGIKFSRKEGRIVKEENLEVIKSGCFHCPYAGTTFYQDLRLNHPTLFQKALDLEANAEKMVFDRHNKPLRAGLVQGKKLSLLDELNLPDSTCDSGAGCFI